VILEIDVLVAVVQYRVLTERDGGLVVDIENERRRFLVQKLAEQPWHAAMAAAMYSASHEEVATAFCFWDCQLMGLLPRKKSTPEVLFLESTSPA
jgi:hypothetical protein